MRFNLKLIAFLLSIILFNLSNAIAEVEKGNDEKAKKEPILEEFKVEATPIVSGIPLEQQSSIGSGLNLALQETPASVEIITKDLIRERANTNALQALENAAGVTVSHSFGILRTQMRGFDVILGIPILYNGFRYPGLAIEPSWCI